MRSLLLLFFFFMTSCTAKWVTKEYHPYKAGVVKYLNAGASGIIEARREDAEDKISSYCDPDGYVLLKESNDSSLDVYHLSPGVFGGSFLNKSSSRYLHLYFRCGDLTTIN